MPSGRVVADRGAYMHSDGAGWGGRGGGGGRRRGDWPRGRAGTGRGRGWRGRWWDGKEGAWGRAGAREAIEDRATRAESKAEMLGRERSRRQKREWESAGDWLATGQWAWLATGWEGGAFTGRSGSRLLMCSWWAAEALAQASSAQPVPSSPASARHVWPYARRRPQATASVCRLVHPELVLLRHPISHLSPPLPATALRLLLPKPPIALLPTCPRPPRPPSHARPTPASPACTPHSLARDSRRAPLASTCLREHGSINSRLRPAAQLRKT